MLHGSSMKPLDEIAAITRHSLAWLQSHGHRWVRANFEMVIGALSKTSLDDASSRRLSRAFFLLGELRWVHEAFDAAATAYKVSRRLDPTFVDPIVELGDIAYLKGKLISSLRYHQFAISMDSSNSRSAESISSLEAIRSQRRPFKPLLAADQPCCKAFDQLAWHRPHAALKLVRGKRSLLAKRIRAMCHGMVGDDDFALDAWIEITNSVVPIELSRTDWFYLSDSMWDNLRFWENLDSCRARIKDLGLMFRGLTDCYRSPEGLITKSAWSTIFSLVLRFHKYRVTQDQSGMRSLFRRHPQWTEVREMLAHHAKHRRFPAIGYRHKGLFL